MKIASRITLGYLVLAVVLSSGLLFEFWLIRDQEVRTRKLVEVVYPASVNSQQLVYQINKLEDFLLKFYVSFDSEYGDELTRQGQTVSALLSSLVGLRLGPDVVGAADKCQQSWKKLAPWLGEVDEDPASVELDDGIAQISKTRAAAQELVGAAGQAFRSAVLEASTARQRAQLGLILVALGTVGATVATAMWTIRSITRPLDLVVHGTRVIGRGDFDHRIPVVGEGEAAELARHFNVMVGRLGEYESMKRELLSHLSHELKAPLASIQETLSILQEEIPGPLNEKQQRLLGLSSQSGRRLGAMIHNLLDLSRLESHAAPYRFELADLGEAVGSVTAEMTPLIEEKGCAVSVELPSSPLMVRFDSERIGQVVRNLIDNAIKFSPAGKPILVRLKPAQHLPASVPDWACPKHSRNRPVAALIEVVDEGPGLSPEQRPRAFEKFQQVGSKGQSAQGIGLGLALCRAIVKAHEGVIWVEDGEQGVGARFCVALGDLGGERFVNPFFRSEKL